MVQLCAGSRIGLARHSSTIALNGISRSSRSISSRSRYLQISEEVQQAVSEGKPVVALETTIYTHGFPYPANLALASRLESLVRVNGAVPATIGILDGVAKVGLGADELVRLVSSAGSSNTWKLSRRDLGFACGLKDADGKAFNGGTTIAATSVLAHLAGIKVFGTGGLGGVHRGVEETMDISADLTELGRTPIAVISSGCKSFLDLPRTLEYLETQGVAVAAFADGRSGDVDFPAFYTRNSGVKAPYTIRDEEDAARSMHAHLSLGLTSGFVFGNPVPEQYSIELAKMEATISEALKEAKAAGATGPASTPFILAKIKELTGEKSVETNRALVEANVARAAKVAAALARLESDEPGPETRESESRITGPASSNYTSHGVSMGVTPPATQKDGAPSTGSRPNTISTTDEPRPNVFVAGSLAMDLACDYVPLSNTSDGSSTTMPALHTSNPARITQALGGVGSNVARAAHLMGADVRLCSAVGDDLPGKAALEAVQESGMSISGIRTVKDGGASRTAQYVAINDGRKDLHLAVADMSILESTSSDSTSIATAFDDFWIPQLTVSKPSHLVIDANWPRTHLARWLEIGRSIQAHATFEPVSTLKGANIFRLPKAEDLPVFPNHSVHLTTPNASELAAMYSAAHDAGVMQDRKDWFEVIDAFGIPHSGARTQLALATSNQLVDQGIPQQSLQLLPFFPTICTKLGADGVLVTQIIPAGDARLNSGDYAPYILSRCANGTEETLGVGGVYMRLFPPAEEVKAADIVSVNGVGDTFAGILVAGLAQKGENAKVEELVDLAQRAAVLTLKSRESVSPGLGTLRILL